MTGTDLFNLAAIGLVMIGLGGIAVIFVREAFVGLRRKARLQDGVGGQDAPAGSAAILALDGLLGGVRRLGDQTDNRDPSQLSALRHRLMLAGFVGPEAVSL